MANINKLNKGIWLAITKIIYRKKFKHIGSHSILFHPLQLDSTKSVEIGDYVFIADSGWIMGPDGDGSMKISNGTVIGHFCHIVSKKNLVIGENVLIADRVFISDCTHRFEDVNNPIQEQGVEILNSVKIGNDSWLGENVCVCGASIGKHCVIGANSVVLNNIPDYSIAVGAPARVVKRFNFETQKWEKVYE